MVPNKMWRRQMMSKLWADPSFNIVLPRHSQVSPQLRILVQISYIGPRDVWGHLLWWLLLFIQLDNIAASLFENNWLSWQIVSDDKNQITVTDTGTRCPEAQKPSWHRGIAIQKVFARPESFCA